MGDISNTQYFKAVQDRKLEVSYVLRDVYEALTEKGYNLHSAPRQSRLRRKKAPVRKMLSQASLQKLLRIKNLHSQRECRFFYPSTTPNSPARCMRRSRS